MSGDATMDNAGAITVERSDSTAAVDFSDIDPGTNTQGVMIIGTGSELVPSGSGIINATRYNGVTTVDATEFGYLNGVTSVIQTQLNAKQATVTDGNALTFTGATLDFDGGATPSGDIGNTWADLVIQPNSIESTMVGADQINDLDINFGTGTDQVGMLDLFATNWSIFYSNGSGNVQELDMSTQSASS